jgi:hypothetical protein
MKTDSEWRYEDVGEVVGVDDNKADGADAEDVKSGDNGGNGPSNVVPVVAS